MTGPDDTRASGGTRGARIMAIVGAAFAVLGVFGPVFGLVGMVLGTLAHHRGDRWGFRVAVLAALTMIVGMVAVFLVNE